AALGLSWHRRQLDIEVYLMGARHLLDGHLYLAALPAPPHLPFTYPPFAALVFAPLNVLPLSAAQVLWSLVNVGALFALVWLSLRATRPGLDRRRRLLWSLVLMAPAFWMEPVHLTFAFGQVNVVLAALALADLTGHLRLGRRTLPRGVLIGVAAAVKLTPLVFVPYLFVTRQTRAAWVALGTFAVCSAATAATDPRVSWSYWTRYATDAKRVGGVFYISNQSLRAVADRVDHRVVSTGLTTAVSAVVLVMGIALARWAWRSSSNLLGVLVCATTGLLASPITWAHHLVWIVPVLIWLVWAPDRPAGGRLWALAGAAMFWRAPIWGVPHGSNVELTEHGWQLLEGNSFFLAMVLFMVGVAVLLTVRRAQPGPGGVAARRIASTDRVQRPLPAGQTADPAPGSVVP
ncbi:MAG TPA: glycosyltransferase 87 family protein, partial [Acidimicrobiales bacterium]|nr:glycosyltransferase 87 family protein [Acidimicrobiales bacterium]